MKEKRKKKKRGNGRGPTALSACSNLKERRVTELREVPSLAGRPAEIEGKPWGLAIRGNCRGQSVAGRTEQDLHRWSTPQFFISE